MPVPAGEVADKEVAVMAETVAGVSVQGVTVAISGGQLASRRVTAEVALGARPINELDCSRAIAVAVAQARAQGRRRL